MPAANRRDRQKANLANKKSPICSPCRRASLACPLVPGLPSTKRSPLHAYSALHSCSFRAHCLLWLHARHSLRTAWAVARCGCCPAGPISSPPGLLKQAYRILGDHIMATIAHGAVPSQPASAIVPAPVVAYMRCHSRIGCPQSAHHGGGASGPPSDPENRQSPRPLPSLPAALRSGKGVLSTASRLQASTPSARVGMIQTSASPSCLPFEDCLEQHCSHS